MASRNRRSDADRDRGDTEPERQRRRAARERPEASGGPAPERTSQGVGGQQVEGYHAVRALLRAGRRPVREVWVVERAGGAKEIVDLASAAGVRVRLTTAERLAERAGSEAPQGLLAFAAPIRPVPVEDLLRGPTPFLVALDGVTDPGNLGAILRTAETAGVTGVVVTRHRGARLGPSALKAAAGAAEYLAFASVAGIPAFLDDARRAGVWSVGLDGGGTTRVDDLAVADGPVVLVLGAEGRGLARLTRERCDVLAAIPLHGHVESLNVSAAAAIALHAVASRRHPEG